MRARAGHNSLAALADRVRPFSNRVERLLHERAELSADIREVLHEATLAGLNSRAILSAAKTKSQAAREYAEILKMYLDALGIDR